MALDLGDIKLDNKFYHIDAQTWKGKDIIDFAPRASVPGGAYVMSDLGLFQPLVQTDFRHGFGFHWYSDSMGYMNTVGRIDTRQDGLAMLFTYDEEGESDDNVKEGLVTFNGSVYFWGAAGLRKYSGGSFSSIYSTTAVNFALAAGSYLFFCPDGARIKKIDTSDTVTDAGLDVNATDYKWLIIHNGYIYAGKDGSNAVHFDNSETLATLQGNSTDTNRILVGLGQSATIGAEVYNGNLYVKKRDGIWVIGEDRIARRTLDFTAEASDDNFRSSAIINGYLVFPLRDRILQWNGARVTNITPHKINDSFPYTTYGRFDNFVAVGDYMYCTGRTNESPYTEVILCWDGVGWHKLVDLLITTSTNQITMLAYEAINNRLWYHAQRTGLGDICNFIQFQDRSAFPYAFFPDSGQHSLITSRLDGGFRRVQKSVSSLFIEARNVNTSTYIGVYYAIDGGDWIFWQNVTENGIIELKNPGGNTTAEFNYIQFRFDFVTDDQTQSPIFEGYTMNFIMRPVTKFGYSFRVIGASHAIHGLHEDDRTSKEILDDLKAIRNSVAPIELIDMQGESHIGYVTSIQEILMTRKVEGAGDQVDIEYSFQVNFVEAI